MRPLSWAIPRTRSFRRAIDEGAQSVEHGQQSHEAEKSLDDHRRNAAGVSHQDPTDERECHQSRQQSTGQNEDD